MKKAKVVLSAVAVFAVIGGAFAFKAARAPQTWYRVNAAGNCQSTFTTALTTNPALAIPGATTFSQSTYNLTPHLGVCTTTIVLSAQ